MRNKNALLKGGLIGIVVTALCCFTPILVVLFAAVGLSALTGYLDFVLLPALVIFIGITIYALARKQSRDACCEKETQETQGE